MQVWQGVAISALLHALIFLIPLHALSIREPTSSELELFMLQESLPAAGGPPAAALPEPPPPEPEAQEEPEVEPEPIKLPKEPVMIKTPPRVVKPKPIPKKKPVNPRPPAKEQLGTADVSPVPGPPGSGQEGSAEPSGPVGGSGPPGPIDASFGSGDGPRFLHKASPRYPRLARELGKEGTVLLRLTIDERGRLTHVEVLRGGGSGFDEEALRAARESSFSPARRNGKAVACRAHLPVRFVLRSSEND